MPQQTQTFDLNAARQSGASDDDILDYLRQRSPDFDLEGALKGGANKKDIVEYLSTHATGPTPAAQQPVGMNDPDRMAARRASAKTDVEGNLPPASVWTGMRDAALGAADAVGLTSDTHTGVLKNAVGGVVNTARRFGEALGNPGKQYDLLKDTVHSVVAPAQEATQGIRENDPGKFMHGVGGIAAVTAPTARGIYEAGAAGAASMPKEGVFQRTPANLLKRTMPNVELEHLQRAGSDLKAAEAATGKPITDVPSALAAEDHQAGVLNDRVGKILDPQKDVVVPGSRQRFIDEQIKEIPDDIRLHDPDRYKGIVDDLNSKTSLGDMTIGDINDARISANKLRRTYYNSKLGAQLSKDEQLNSAMLAGRDRAAHSLLDYGVDQVGLGGAGAIKNLTQRLGSMIKVKEGLQGLVNPAELEAGAPTVSRFGKRVANVVDQVKGNPAAFDRSLSINEDIAQAMRRWQGKPAEFSVTQSPAFARPNAKAPGGQQDLLPNNGGGPLTSGPATSQPHTNAMMDVQRRKVWNNAAPQPSKGQLDLERGMAPDLLGIRVPEPQPPSPQPSLRFSGEPIEQTPTQPVGTQKSFSFPKTDREMFLDDYFKQNPNGKPGRFSSE